MGETVLSVCEPEAAPEGPQSLVIQEEDTVMLIERRSLRPFKTSEEYLYAMREDLAEWLNSLYDLQIDVDNFFEKLENGVALCRHSNGVRRTAQEQRTKIPTSTRTRWEVPHYDVYYRPDAASGSFFARDNVHNFIKWCRDLGVHDVLMFETDDLVLRKNEKHVILALLEIARRGARFGVQAPVLVQMEADIDREIESDRLAEERRLRIQEENTDNSWEIEQVVEKPHEPLLVYGPKRQIVTNDLKSLDEMVRDLVARCTCPSQFPMIKVSEGKYRIGDTKVLIFVRILRNHVMVRVGGGWDTLHHYLDKHDPCRCKSGHRFSNLSKVGYKHVNQNTGDRQLSSVTYERSDENLVPGSPMARRKQSKLRKESLEGHSLRQRSQSPAIKSLQTGVDDAAPSSPEVWCDSSSEVSDEGYKSTGAPRPTIRVRKPSQKPTQPNDYIERPESAMTQLSSEGSSADDVGGSLSPPRSPPVSSTKNSSLSKPQWNSSSKTNLPPAQKSKFSFLDIIQSRLSVPKRVKKVSAPEAVRPIWNAGLSPKKTSVDNRTRRSSSSEPMQGRVLSRSQSASSEGGFENMSRMDTPVRQSFRGSPRKILDAGKKTWTGRSRGRDYPAMTPDTYLPPVGRSVRSASASPATTRRRFPTSAPTTPAVRSPKRSMPNSVMTSPTEPLPAELFMQLPDMTGDGDVKILAHLEHLFNSYKTRLANKLAAEGKVLPPELAGETICDHERKDSPVKITPRKDGVGSRIPAPIFFKPQAN